MGDKVPEPSGANGKIMKDNGDKVLEPMERYWKTMGDKVPDGSGTLSPLSFIIFPLVPDGSGTLSPIVFQYLFFQYLSIGFGTWSPIVFHYLSICSGTLWYERGSWHDSIIASL